MTSQHPICNRTLDGQSSSRNRSIPAIRYLTVHSIQTQLYFEILYGLQNRFTAETDLIQRRLASTLKWSHYKFKSSENHRQMNQVHMPVVWISYWAELVLQRRFCKRMSDPSVAVCKRKVFKFLLCLGRHAKQMPWHPNFQHVIDPSDGQSSARSRTPFAFKEFNSHYVWHVVIDAQTKI